MITELVIKALLDKLKKELVGFNQIVEPIYLPDLEFVKGSDDRIRAEVVVLDNDYLKTLPLPKENRAWAALVWSRSQIKNSDDNQRQFPAIRRAPVLNPVHGVVFKERLGQVTISIGILSSSITHLTNIEEFLHVFRGDLTNSLSLITTETKIALEATILGFSVDGVTKMDTGTYGTMSILLLKYVIVYPVILMFRDQKLIVDPKLTDFVQYYG